MSKPGSKKTIARLFAEFLVDQEARLGSRTYAKYEGIIDLFHSYLERYWPGHDDLEEYNAITGTGATYCGTFGAEDIARAFPGFLGDFMPRKVIAGDGTMKAAGTVVKKLARWLIEKGYTEDDESIRALVGATARDLPASQRLLDRLDDWLGDQAHDDGEKTIEGHFWIKRVGPGQLWLEPMYSGDPEIGPVPVPEEVSRACKVGWDVGCAMAETTRGWRLVEVWSIAP